MYYPYILFFYGKRKVSGVHDSTIFKHSLECVLNIFDNYGKPLQDRKDQNIGVRHS